MKKLSTRERTLIGLLVAGVASLLFFLLLLRPLQTEAGQLRRGVHEKQQQLKEQQRLVRSLPRLKQNVQELQTQIALLSRPDVNPTPEVVRQIWQLAAEQGLQLVSIHPSEPEYLDNSTKYATSFEARATFPEIVKTLHELEKSPHFLWVEGVEISGDRSADALSMNAVVAVYSCHAPSGSSHAKN